MTAIPSNLRPYPVSIPAESWQIVSELLQGHTPTMAHNTLVHTVEDTVAFVLGKGFPDGPVIMAAACGPDCTDEECLDHIKRLAHPVTMATGDATAIPWKAILAKLLPLLIQLLS